MSSWNRRSALSSFFTRVAMGKISGAYIIKKFGFNNNISTLSTVWDEGGLYEYLESPEEISIASTDIEDSITGEGARTVQIEGLDENWKEKIEIVELNGQTPVVIGEFLRIYRMKVITAGIKGSAEGLIRSGYGSFTNGVPNNTLALINKEINQTLMSLYSVPANKVAFIFDYFSNSGKSGEISVDSYARTFGSVFRIHRRVNLFESTFFHPNNLPFFFDEKTDIESRAESSVGTPISVGFDILVVDKNFLNTI